MNSTTLHQRIAHFDAYFRSANSVPPNARISVPTAEWQELHTSLTESDESHLRELTAYRTTVHNQEAELSAMRARCAELEAQNKALSAEAHENKLAVRWARERIAELETEPCPQAALAAVPVGWKLVPMNPTAEMCKAANWSSSNRQRWADMLAAAPAHPAEGVPASPTLMTEDQACVWAWKEVREDVGTESWTAGESANFYGFFLWGWRYRAQYELQRAATRSAVMQELTAAPAASAPQAQDVQRDAARVSLPIHWMKELVALCGPEDHELRDRVLKSLERLPLAHAGKLDELNKGEVLVVVTGYTGTGKSAVAGEIEIMCRALGLEVEWPGGDSEKNMTHADWTAALEQYRPRVRIVERNVPGPIAAQAAQGEA